VLEKHSRFRRPIRGAVLTQSLISFAAGRATIADPRNARYAAGMPDRLHPGGLWAAPSGRATGRQPDAGCPVVFAGRGDRRVGGAAAYRIVPHRSVPVFRSSGVGAGGGDDVKHGEARRGDLVPPRPGATKRRRPGGDVLPRSQFDCWRQRMKTIVHSGSSHLGAARPPGALELGIALHTDLGVVESRRGAALRQCGRRGGARTTTPGSLREGRYRRVG
jgi:hypothetical protein